MGRTRRKERWCRLCGERAVRLESAERGSDWVRIVLPFCLGWGAPQRRQSLPSRFRVQRGNVWWRDGGLTQPSATRWVHVMVPRRRNWWHPRKSVVLRRSGPWWSALRSRALREPQPGSGWPSADPTARFLASRLSSVLGCDRFTVWTCAPRKLASLWGDSPARERFPCAQARIVLRPCRHSAMMLRVSMLSGTYQSG